MSALSDFLTQDTSPWWGSGLVGISGTLLGIGINSRIANKRDDKQAERDATARAEQNRLDDRRRWDNEVHDLVVLANESAAAIQNNALRVPSDPTSGQFDTGVWQDHYEILKKISNKLESVAPAAVYEAADRLRSAALPMYYHDTADDLDAAQISFENHRAALQAAFRTEHRIDD